MKRKILLMFILFLSVVMLVACGKQQSTSVYDLIIDESYTDTIILGTSADYPPYEWPKNENGKQTLVGIDIELSKLIAKRLGKNLRVINKGFDFLLEDLQNGRVDFVLSGMNPTPERAAIVDFSRIYYAASQVVIIHKNKESQLSDLTAINQNNIKIGAQLGSIQQNLADEYFPKSVKQYLQNVSDLVMQLNDQSIDALILEKPVAQVYTKQYADFLILDAAIGNPEDGSAAAVKKGNQALLDVINEVLDELILSGEMDLIIADAIALNEQGEIAGGFSFLLDKVYIQTLLKGLLMTLILALLSVFFGCLIGFFIALMRLSFKKYLNIIASAYVNIIRGTPLLVQVLLIYAVIQIPVTIVVGIDLSNFIPGMIALLINSSAYVAEIIRGGILSVDKGQTEAGLSLGLSDKKIMQKIILPQAIKNIIPSLGNEFVSMIKETSIFMYLGVAELMYSAQVVKTQTYAIKEVYITVAVLYLVLTLSTAKVMSVLERKLRKNDGK